MSLIKLTLRQSLAFNHSKFWIETMASRGSLFRAWWKVYDACHSSRSKRSHETFSSSMKEVKLLCLFWAFRLICLDVLSICSFSISRRQPLVMKLKKISELSLYLISDPTGALSMSHSSPRKVFWALGKIWTDIFNHVRISLYFINLLRNLLFLSVIIVIIKGTDKTQCSFSEWGFDCSLIECWKVSKVCGIKRIFTFQFQFKNAKLS